jgi:histidine ammonia-lyase
MQAANVAFNEKEAFIVDAKAHVYQAVFALAVYKMKENLSFYDSVLALSCELLHCHVDAFTEYAFTLGKQSQGLVQFRNNMLALTDHSKLLNSQPAKEQDRQLA